MKAPSGITLGLLGLALLILFSGQVDGCSLPVIGQKPPFAVPSSKSVAVMVAAHAEPADIQKYTSAQADVLSESRQYVDSLQGAGVFRLVQTPPSDNEEQWVRDAYAKKGDSLPWVVAAGPKSGLSRAVPPDVKAGDVLAELKSITGK